jgi:hypothetical protein
MKAYSAVCVYIHVFLTPEIVVEWSASGPGLFTAGETFSDA